jgi:hypothetical protein
MTIEPSLTGPGERLLWSGRPVALRYALRKSMATFLFGLVFFSFAVFWVHGAAFAECRTATDSSGFPFFLYGIPFVAIRAGMLLSPLWHFWRGQRTRYALTDERAVIDTAGPFARRVSVPLHVIRFVELRGSTPVGDVVFQESIVSDSNGATARRDGFIAIADAARVEQLLRSTIERKRERDKAR